MIRVLHFVSTPSIGSGVMSVIMNYYRHMDRSKIQFDFLCFIPCEDSYEKEINELGGRVFFVSKPGSSLKSIKELLGFFKSHKGEYQWLHNHEVYLSFLLKLLANQFQIPKFIVHCHATQYSDRRMAAIRNRLLCMPIRFMHCERFACSTDAGAFLFGHKAMKENDVGILHNGIDIEKYCFDQDARVAIRNQYNLSDSYVIGHVGRFNNQKNHVFLIELFWEISKTIPDARLILVGDGPLREIIHKKCYELDLEDKVLFMGQRADINKLYSAMDLFVLPSIYEGVGIALLEAQANGLTCLASDRVPVEAQIRKEFMFLPLNGVKWKAEIQQIYEKLARNRQLDILYIKEAFRSRHYDIEKESCWLQEYYEDTNIDVYI